MRLPRFKLRSLVVLVALLALVLAVLFQGIEIARMRRQLLEFQRQADAERAASLRAFYTAQSIVTQARRMVPIKDNVPDATRAARPSDSAK
jgi:hypothetical protein